MEIVDELTKFLVKERGGSDKLEKELDALKSGNEKVSYIYSVLEGKESFLPNVKNKKNEELALQAKLKGNAYVAENKFSSARRMYTESIAFAPLESETLAIAYANRSAALYRMGYLKDTVADVNRALHCNYPLHLRYKVLARQGDCFKELGQSSQAYQCFSAATNFLEYSFLQGEHKEAKRTKYAEEMKSCNSKKGIEVENVLNFNSLLLDPPTLKIPELTFKESKEVLGVAECIDLKYDEKVGRHFIANRDLQPGDIVMVEQPYVAHLYPKFWRCMCCHCGLRCVALLACELCTWAMFCSEECRHAAKEIHEIEYSIMPALYECKIRDHNSINMMKILIKTGFKQIAAYLESEAGKTVKDKRTAGFTNGKYDPNNFNAIFHSQSKSREIIFVEELIGLVTSCIFIKLLEDIAPEAIKYGGMINHLYWCVHVNGTEMREVYNNSESPKEHDVTTGSAYYPTYNLINHSCDPTLGRDFFGFHVVLRAIKPIKKGEELTLAYHYRFTYFDKSQRQFLLLLKNGFKCKCEACENDWPLVDDMPMYPSFSNPEKKKAYIQCAKKLIPLHEQVGRDEVITSAMAFRFIKHLTLLSGIKGGHLCIYYNLCQQALEQYWARQSNYFVDKYL